MLSRTPQHDRSHTVDKPDASRLTDRARVVGLISGPLRWRWLAFIWFAVVFLLVRIASHGEFKWNALASAYDQDPVQFALLVGTAIGSLLFAARAIRRRTSRSDGPSVGWSLVVTVVAVALWRLGHDSAPVIFVLAVLGGLLAGPSQGAGQTG